MSNFSDLTLNLCYHTELMLDVIILFKLQISPLWKLNAVPCDHTQTRSCACCG